MTELMEVARKSGARVTVWAEAVTAMHAPLAPNATTLQLWANGQEEVVAALEEGYSLIYSNASEWYLDCGEGNWLHGGRSWCAPYHSWQVAYAAEPTAHLPAKYASQILGGEVALWGEQTSALNLESKLWTRTAAAAERLWAPLDALAGCTPPPIALPITGCWKDAQDRMRLVNAKLAGAGFAISPTQPKYCLRHPEMCDAYY